MKRAMPWMAFATLAVVVLVGVLPGGDPAYDELVRRCGEAGGQVVDFGPTGADCVRDGQFVRVR